MIDREEIFRLRKQCLRYDWQGKTKEQLKIYRNNLIKVIDGLNEIDEPVDKGLTGDLSDVINAMKELDELNLNQIPKANDVLLTKDGRSIGNCIVKSVKEGNSLLTVITDYGNEVTLPMHLVSKYFHTYYKQAPNTHKHFTLAQPKPTKKYLVRLEFKVVSCEFIDITVNAKDAEEAKQVAIKRHNEDPQWSEMYAGDSIETTLDTKFIKDWEVLEVE